MFRFLFNQLAASDEYTRHVQMAIFSVTTSAVVNKIKKYNGPFVTT